MKLNTYLNFGGNCEETFRFYEQHLRGKIMSMMKWSQMPDAEKHTSPGYENAVLHGRITLGETVIMASDVPKERFQQMRSVYLSLYLSAAAKRRNGFMRCSPMAVRST
jgi:PhnB protein